jgi:hypothetical protein
MQLASGIPGNRLDNIGRPAHGGIPQMSAVFFSSSTLSFMLNHASLEPL